MRAAGSSGGLETVDYTHRERTRQTAFKAKRKQRKRKKIYAQRSQVEFAHAWIKERCGLRQFRCGVGAKPRWRPLAC